MNMAPKTISRYTVKYDKKGIQVGCQSLSLDQMEAMVRECKEMSATPQEKWLKNIPGIYFRSDFGSTMYIITEDGTKLHSYERSFRAKPPSTYLGGRIDRPMTEYFSSFERMKKEKFK